MKPIAYLLALVVVIGGAYTLMRAQGSESAEDRFDKTADSAVSGMRAEENMVLVVEQKPGKTILVSQVLLKEPGYVVIHEDNQGSPGDILGTSSLLPAGQSENVSVTLSRESRDGEKLHAMLHGERGGNTAFDESTDTPVMSMLGGPLSGWFDISSTAQEPAENGITL